MLNEIPYFRFSIETMNYFFTIALLTLSWPFVAQSPLKMEQAEELIALPIKCIQREFPNKLGQVLNDSIELQSPAQLHPAFYGCFDWHSAVHGHWLMVRLIKQFPTLQQAAIVKEMLRTQLTATNIQREIAFFNTQNNQSFERTYGWAWVLKLQQELDTWEDSLGRELANNLLPLSQLLCSSYQKFLPKLVYPIRTGEHNNTAFGLIFALDYAKHAHNDTLQELIIKRAKDFYLNDKNYDLSYEPSGYDFLSPAFEEIDLMRRVLPSHEFNRWLHQFLPAVYRTNFQLEVGKVGDRTDGKLVHLDGLNFSRSWCLIELSKLPHLSHLYAIANQHISYSLPAIVDGDYMGEHWLASFALLALSFQ